MYDWRTLDRLARRYPRTTAGVALANAAPLAGVLLFSWSVALVLVFYWIETGVVLLFSMAAGLVASDPGDTSDDDLPLEGLIDSDRRIELRSGWPPVRVRNVPVVAGLAVLFGMFWVVHGVFVGVFAAMLSGTEGLAAGPWVLVSLLGVVANQANEFYEEQVVEERYRDATAKGQLGALVGRTLVLHVALVFGGFLVVGAATLLPGAGVAFLALLVALKAPFELAVATHRRASEDTLDRRSPPPRAPSAPR